MASNSLTLYKDNTTTEVLNLVTTSENAARWIKSGRALATPLFAAQKVKINKGISNDDSHFLVGLTEMNPETGKLATFLVDIRISIPKDQTVLTPTKQNEVLSMAASALINQAGTGAVTARQTLIEGRIL